MDVVYLLVGPDGSTVRQIGDMAGARWRFQDNPEGQGGAPWTNQSRANVRQRGRTWIGRNLDALPVRMKLMLKGGKLKGQAAIDEVKLMRRILGYGDTICILFVVSPGGGERWQILRREAYNPNLPISQIMDVGWYIEQTDMMGDESMWQKNFTPVAFTPAQFATATIVNAGDIESPLKYKFTGPMTNPKIGVGGEQIECTGVTIPAGQTWELNTDPENPYFINAAGGNVWPTIGVKSWHKLVPGRGVTTPVYMTAGGTNANSRITLSMPQFFYEAV